MVLIMTAPKMGAVFMELMMKNEFKSFLTTKHQLRLLLQVLDEWILPSQHFDEYDKASLITASDLLSVVHTSLECKFKENLEGLYE